MKHHNALPIRSANLFSTGVFLALVTFVMSVSLITVANTSSSVFDEEAGTRLYYFCIVAWTFGFWGYALIDRLIKSAAVRQTLLISAAVLSVSAFSNVAYAYSKSTYAVFSLLCLFTFGILYAAVYHKIALRLNGSPYTGRFFGISVAGVELFIWPVTSLIANPTVTYLTVLAALVLTSFYLRTPVCPIDKDEREQPVKGVQSRTIIALVIVAALIGIMVGMTEQIYMTHVIEGNIKMQDWPRLIHAVSILVMGFLVDIKKRRYLALTTICVMMLFSIGIILWESSYPLWIAMCVYYAFRASGIIFFTVSFLDLAPQTKRPGLWSAMGRLTASFAEPVLFFAMVFLRPNLLGMIFISLFSAVLLFLTVLWGRLFIQKSEQQTIIRSAELVPLEELTASYGITNRELEVLRLLLNAKNTSDIAAEMVVTEKTVQNYVGSLLSKTGSKSRGEMIAKFRSVNP